MRRASDSPRRGEWTSLRCAGTPTLFIGGVLYVGSYDAEALREALIG